LTFTSQPLSHPSPPLLPYTTLFRSKAVLRAGVPDLAHGLPDDAWNVDVAVRRDLPHHDHQAGGDDRLACDAGQRVLGQDRVEDGVGDLVGQLVGMAFGD